MCGHSGDFQGKGAGHGHDGCGCHLGQHGNTGCHGHGVQFSGHGWAFLKHEERVERLVQAKKGLETQLAEIQKTLSLLQPTDESQDLQENGKDTN